MEVLVIICVGHFERPPYNESQIRSIYHVREYDVHKLMQVEKPIDIFLSHDWPLGITDCGNWEALVRFKPYFKKEVIFICYKINLSSVASSELFNMLPKKQLVIFLANSPNK